MRAGAAIVGAYGVGGECGLGGKDGMSGDGFGGNGISLMSTIGRQSVVSVGTTCDTVSIICTYWVTFGS